MKMKGQDNIFKPGKKNLSLSEDIHAKSCQKNIPHCKQKDNVGL